MYVRACGGISRQLRVKVALDLVENYCYGFLNVTIFIECFMLLKVVSGTGYREIQKKQTLR